MYGASNDFGSNLKKETNQLECHILHLIPDHAYGTIIVVLKFISKTAGCQSIKRIILQIYVNLTTDYQY